MGRTGKLEVLLVLMGWMIKLFTVLRFVRYGGEDLPNPTLVFGDFEIPIIGFLMFISLG